VDLAVHLVHGLLPVPSFDLCFHDVSHGRVKVSLLGQLVTVHEPHSKSIKQSTKGGLLQKIEV